MKLSYRVDGEEMADFLQLPSKRTGSLVLDGIKLDKKRFDYGMLIGEHDFKEFSTRNNGSTMETLAPCRFIIYGYQNFFKHCTIP